MCRSRTQHLYGSPWTRGLHSKRHHNAANGRHRQGTAPASRLNREAVETVTAPKVDSVSCIGSANRVVPKPISVRVECIKLALRLQPKYVTVVLVSQRPRMDKLLAGSLAQLRL